MSDPTPERDTDPREEDSAAVAEEEYTAYRETDPDAIGEDPEAGREADLQPGAPDTGEADPDR